MKRLAITGSSGYLGTRLIEYFRRTHAGTTILGLDEREPERASPDMFIQIDIRSPELGRETGRCALQLPFWLAYAVHWLFWAIRLQRHESPAGLLYFIRYPWVIAPTRLERELGYQFCFTSLDTLRRTIQRDE